MKTMSTLIMIFALVTGSVSLSYAVVPPNIEGAKTEKSELAERLAGIQARLEAVDKDLQSVVRQYSRETHE